MSKRAGKFYPGWKMTREQHASYWWHIGQCAKSLGLSTAAGREELRATIHVRAFGANVSAKSIDHLKMFDDFKSQCLAILKPADLEAQLRQVQQPLIRLRHAILQFPEAYVAGLLGSARFKGRSLADLQDMDEKELTDLRNTLCARVAKQEVAAPAALENFQPQPELEGDPF
jgi:hypothetical protein